LENYLGSEALLQRIRHAWPGGETPPYNPIDLFRLAEEGHATALAHVECHARDIGQLVAACVSVLDPDLVVLGGGVGQNRLILPKVRQVVEELTVPARVEVTSLGAEATLMGIEYITLRQAQALLIGESAA
jgi:predicted NBD/HSP70 family sugar kinase